MVKSSGKRFLSNKKKSPRFKVYSERNTYEKFDLTQHASFSLLYDDTLGDINHIIAPSILPVLLFQLGRLSQPRAMIDLIF